MGLFETGIVQVTSTVGTISSLVWQPSNQSTTTYGALGSITTGDTLKDVTIINSGPGTVYVGMGSIVASATPLAAQINPGGQLTFQGYTLTAGTSTAGNIWGITPTGGTTASTTAGLASIASVV